ncbi:MAG: sulfatase [Verrucomicrobiales bacterium]|nr:sulfatase [Verrucomicrobiales bacterium]
MNSSAPTPPAVAPPKGIWIFPWTLCGILLLHLGIFGVSIYNLKSNTGALDNKFSEVALNDFSDFLAYVNLDLLRGYALVAAAILLLAWPVVKWSLRKKRKISRWGIVWRAALVGLAVWFFFFLRFFYTRPFYFTLDPHWQNVYFAIAGWLPDFAKDVLFKAGPWILAGLVAVHYSTALVRWRAKRWPLGACRAVGVMNVALLAVGWIGFNAYSSRVDAVVRRDPRPNILVLASDSLRADHLSCNGYPKKTTPHVDALAAQSVNFTKCLTPISSTLESMTSMMTSQYPHTHGLQHMFPNRQQVERVRKLSPTLAGQLRKNGYDTSVLGDWCAGVFDMMNHGFEHVDVSTFDNFQVYMTQAVYREHAVLPLFFDNDFGYWMFPGLRSCASFVTPEVVTERLKEKLTAQARSEKPFFCTAFFSITHLPYAINPPFSTKFTNPAYKGPHQGRMQLDVDKFIGSVDIGEKWRELPREDVEQIVGLYDGCVAKFDDVVRQVVEHLKKTGQFDNTVILITGDHGDDLFEPNCTFGHGLTFNGGDQNSNIPCILHVPGREGKPQKIDRIVRSIDFAPTLLDLAGVKPDPRMEGVSLRPCIEAPATDLSLAFFGETSYLFCKRHVPGEKPHFLPPMDSTTFVDRDFNCHFVLRDQFTVLEKGREKLVNGNETVLQTKERCLRTERWKLVFTPGQDKEIWRLFDLGKDPHCEVPVNLEHPEVFSTMHRHLLAWMHEKKEARIKDIFPNGEPAGVVAFRPLTIPD